MFYPPFIVELHLLIRRDPRKLPFRCYKIIFKTYTLLSNKRGDAAMNFEMQKANMLAKNINEFIKFIQKSHENKRTDKVYQIKLLMEEFKFQILADELLRINQYSWDEKYTCYLVDRFIEGINVIEEYVKHNYDDVYIFSARLHTLMNLSLPFTKKE